MNANDDKLAAATQFATVLAPLIPGVQPYAGALITLLPIIRSIFMDNGGTSAGFDALLADSRKNIDMLANPNQFRHAPPTTLPSPPSSMYATLMTGAVLDDAGLLALGYQNGDKVCVAGAAWMMIRKGQPTLGATVLRTIGE